MIQPTDAIRDNLTVRFGHGPRSTVYVGTAYNPFWKAYVGYIDLKKRVLVLENRRAYLYKTDLQLETIVSRLAESEVGRLSTKYRPFGRVSIVFPNRKGISAGASDAPLLVQKFESAIGR